MNKLNTLLRVVYTLGLCLILSQYAVAQPGQDPKSVLNFVKATVSDQSNAGIAVTNPTANYADVQFTFYGLDGNPVSSGLLNPVRYRVAPKGQISVLARDLFAVSGVDGWVQATSLTPDLIGSYLVGDFAKTLEGAAPATALSTQVVPLIQQDANNDTTLIVVNPSSSGTSTVTIAFYGSAGQQLGGRPRPWWGMQESRFTPRRSYPIYLPMVFPQESYRPFRLRRRRLSAGRAVCCLHPVRRWINRQRFEWRRTS